MTKSYRTGALILLLAVTASGCDSPSAPAVSSGVPSGAVTQSTESQGRELLYFRHPMDPSITSAEPTQDEMGMDYIPVYGDANAPAGEIHLSDSFVQKLGVRTESVQVGLLSDPLRASGVIKFDERLVTEGYVIVTGRVERLSVRSVGEMVRSGQLLFELYSPALEIVDEQYLQSLDGDKSYAENPYVNGLRTFGMTEDLITDLREKRRAVGRIPVRANAAGVITALNFRNGAMVTQGDSVLQWVSTDPVWAIVQVPAAWTADLTKGQSATVVVPALRGEKLSARIDYIYPDADPIAGAALLRLVLPNPTGRLRPNMPVSALIEGSDTAEVLHVPREAVIRDGVVDRVILALGDGRFVPRRVSAGRERGDRIPILEGLVATDRVVTSGLFLIDAESNIRSSLARMTDQPVKDLVAKPATSP